MRRFTQFLVGNDKKNTFVPTPTTLSLIGVAAIWGGTFIAGRQLADSSPPILSAFLRFAIASIALALCLPRQQIKLNEAQKNVFSYWDYLEYSSTTSASFTVFNILVHLVHH
jgi:drug/metabolite transporter (DMT)-like permease